MTESKPPHKVPFVALFEKAPHVTLVLDPDLAILAANEAGLRFFDMEPAQLTGKRLFDVLPEAVDGDSGWQARLRQSYGQILATGLPVSMLLAPLDGFPVDSEAATAAPQVASRAQSAPATCGPWHVCHTPLHDDHGALVAIATYALQLRGCEIVGTQAAGSAPMPDAPLRMPAVTTVAVAGNDIVTDRFAAVPARIPPLPSAPASIPVDSDAATDGAAGQAIGASATSAGLRILMVEDNDDLRMVNVDQLEMLGHQVTSTADAEQALRHLETSTFDLLFTDLTLPRMTGAELARLVLQQHHPMRVVITSGYGRAMANAQSLDALFLPKPYRFADLQEVLRQARLRRDG